MTDAVQDAYIGFTLGGVQEFIGAARRTADLWAASTLMSHLSKVAQRTIGEANVVLPSHDSPGRPSPNRIFACVPNGHGAQIAQSAAEAVRSEWRALTQSVHGGAGAPAESALVAFPDVKWVAYEPPTGAPSSYAEAWQAVGEGLVARKRLRDFPGYVASGQVCSLCGRRAAGVVPAPLRLRQGEELCPVCAVKRDVGEIGRRAGIRLTSFPSTASVASAPFRARVLDAWAAAGPRSQLGSAVRGHHEAVAALAGALRQAGLDDSMEGGKGALPELERRGEHLGSLERPRARLAAMGRRLVLPRDVGPRRRPPRARSPPGRR